MYKILGTWRWLARRWQFSAVLCAASTSLTWTDTCPAAWEGVTFGVENFEVCAPGSDRLYFRNYAEEFADALTVNGYDTVATPQYDKGVDGVDFIEDAWGGADSTSPTGTDWADTVFVATHGAIWGSAWICSYATRANQLVMGDGNATTCYPYMISNSTTDMLFTEDSNASSDLNYLVTSACHSAQYCLLLSPGIFNLDGNGTGTQFQLLNGFHGFGWDSADWPDYFYDYVVGAKSNGIGDDFIDVFGYVGPEWDDDICPMAVGLGDNLSEVDDVLEYGGFMDAHSSGTHDEQWARVVCDCDPPGGPGLPDC